MNKSRFEKADILEITVKYLEALQLEERRIYLQGFDACLSKMVEYISKVSSMQSPNTDTPTIKTEPDVDVNTYYDKNDLPEDIPEPLKSLEDLYAKLKLFSNEMHQDKLFSKGTNLSSLFAELNEIKSQSAFYSDSDQHSADEILQLDQIKISGDEKYRKKSINESTVIQHTSKVNTGSNNNNSSHTQDRRAHSNSFYDTRAHSKGAEAHTINPFYLPSNKPIRTSSSSSPPSSSSTSPSISLNSLKLAQNQEIVPQLKPINTTIPSWNSSPFYNEMYMPMGNERNGNDIWRPWGCGHR